MTITQFLQQFPKGISGCIKINNFKGGINIDYRLGSQGFSHYIYNDMLQDDLALMNEILVIVDKIKKLNNL